MRSEINARVEYQEQLCTGSIDFIFCNHSTRNLSRVIEAISASDGDIIAIEKIATETFGMGTEEEKHELSLSMTNFIAADSTMNMSATEYLGVDDPLYTQLLDSLKGTGKRIELIDMGLDDPDYCLDQQAVRLGEEYCKKVKEWDSASKEDRKIIKLECDDLRDRIVLAYGRLNMARENLMQKRIIALTTENPG